MPRRKRASPRKRFARLASIIPFFSVREMTANAEFALAMPI